MTRRKTETLQKTWRCKFQEEEEEEAIEQGTETFEAGSELAAIDKQLASSVNFPSVALMSSRPLQIARPGNAVLTLILKIHCCWNGKKARTSS